MAEEEKEQQVQEQPSESPDGAGLLDKIIEQGRMARDKSQEPYARDMLGEFVTQVLDEGMTVQKDTVAAINQRIADIDELLTAQVNEIMHAEEFQKLEGSWKGLEFLVKNTETSPSLKLRLLNISKKDVHKDLERAVEFDQSQLFKKIYEAEYGVFGGMPYSLLIGDYEFGRHPQDIDLLEKMSNVAAAAHAPFIAAASPDLFDMDSFNQLSDPRDLSKIFESKEAGMIKWRSFRDSEDSRYVALVMPHILMRLPYGAKTKPVEGFNFEEDVSGKVHGKYLWGNAAYALGQRIADAFSKFNWCAAIRGVEGGGLVEGLPTHTFGTDEGDIALKCPTEIAITDRREKELSDLGFISLVHCKGKDYAAFFGGQTTQKPKVYNTDEANANARISTVLPYVFTCSRIAHYMKSMMRDKIGSFATADKVSVFLNNWIRQYVLDRDDADQELKAKHPLREARIDVTEVPGKPGSYKAVAFLRPHFQLEELTASIRLVADLPKPAK